MVYLVGAGPGDPGLITVKALDILKKADVVIYDRLAYSGFLLETKPDCILVDVGKSAGEHTKNQDEITNLLVEYGRTNSAVVRLKGGDPFLFGRGGEEAERLADEHIPFVVIPGISALNAVSAYAGIPVTHRDFASSFGVATGHAAQGTADDPVRWKKLAEGVDTIVVFMGVGNIDKIIREITSDGYSNDTPAALVERGCTPLQRVVTGTLGTISERARKENVKPPALFIVSRTVPLSEKLNWFKPGPLAGLRVGVTRPLAQSKSFSEELYSLGAMPVLMPTIETIDTIENQDVAYAMDKLDSYNNIIFSSTNGVDSFFRALKSRGKDSRTLAGKKIAAIGPVTGDVLSGYGITADMTAETFVAEGMLDIILSAGSVEGQKFLLVRSDIGRDTLLKGLESAGGIVDHAAFYSTRTAELRPYVIKMIENDEIDVVTFTSSSTVDGFFSHISADSLGANIKIASIGPQTSLAIKRHNKTPDIEAEVFTTAGLAKAILAKYGKE
ncbi:uroporphyrinogen-III C-methyltransferase [Candidatus Latescibacterota bacterium]